MSFKNYFEDFRIMKIRPVAKMLKDNLSINDSANSRFLNFRHITD